MASAPSSHVYLEVVEETTYKSEEPHPMRHRQMAGLSMGQHEQRLLAYSWQLDTHPSNR